VGPLGGKLWIAHDPSKNVTTLKGVGACAAASGGAQGDVDRLAPGTANFTGGLIKGIVLANTHEFADAAAAAGVPISSSRGLAHVGAGSSLTALADSGGRAVKSAAAVGVDMWQTRARTDRTSAVDRQPDAGRSP
jgi:hypothetical protein